MPQPNYGYMDPYSAEAQEIERKYLNDPSLEQKDRDSWCEIYFRILENLRKQNLERD